MILIIFFYHRINRCIYLLLKFFLYLILQRDIERDQNNHSDMLDEKVDYKMGRDFRSLGHHRNIVHLHSGIEHLNNTDVEVLIFILDINLSV